MKICIDPGHGGEDSGAVGSGLREKDLTLDLGLRLREHLQGSRTGILMTREDDRDVSLPERVSLANEFGAGLFFSIHINGHPDPQAHGYEDFIHPEAVEETVDIRDAMHPVMAKVWTDAGRANRGKKTANFHVLREMTMPAVLAEHGFISSPADVRLLGTSAFRRELADAMAEAVFRALDLDPVGSPIVGDPTIPVMQARVWVHSREAHRRFLDASALYWEYGERTGIRSEVAYAQSALETRFGHYGGTVRPEQNNWAGIKTRDTSGDEPGDHEAFASAEEGVHAHFNHLAAYTDREPTGEPHGRYHLVVKHPGRAGSATWRSWEAGGLRPGTTAGESSGGSCETCWSPRCRRESSPLAVSLTSWRPGFPGWRKPSKGSPRGCRRTISGDLIPMFDRGPGWDDPGPSPRRLDFTHQVPISGHTRLARCPVSGGTEAGFSRELQCLQNTHQLPGAPADWSRVLAEVDHFTFR